MIRRGCIIHGKNVGLHGDKTSTGAQCIAARPGMSVMGLLKLYTDGFIHGGASPSELIGFISRPDEQWKRSVYSMDGKKV